MEQQSISPQSGADILRPIFICKLVRSGVNPDDLLEEYKLALKGMPRRAIIRTVDKIRTGMLCQANNFCPLPPELASLVREQWRLERIMNAPVSLPAPSQSSMQAQMEKRWSGQRVLLDGIDLAMFSAMAKHGKIPAGAVHVPILDKVFAAPPPEFFGEKPFEKQNAVMQRYREKREQDKRAYYRTMDEITEANRDHWKQVSILKDNPHGINADQAAFRDQVEQQLGDQ